MLKKYFLLDELGTSWQRELIAGATTFMTMAYIIIVNPKILEAAGMPFASSMAATIYTAVIGTLLMGFYAKRPFAIAPYMGENAFIAFTVVKVLGYSWQTALGAIFIGGILFTIITIFKIRSWLANSIPESLKIAFAVGIGFFLTFIGLNATGIVILGVPGAPVHIGDLRNPQILLAVIGFLLIGFLMLKQVRGAMLIGIIIISAIMYILGLCPLPERWIDSPPDITPLFLQLDIMGALNIGFFAVILTIFVMDFVDTLGTLLGLSMKAGFLDRNGNLPEVEKPMLADALATVFAALFGTTTAGAYIESAAGVEAGGKSGLTAVFTALFFLLGLFFAPIFGSIPQAAYGPPVIIVGMLMLSPIKNINFDDLSEVIPVFTVIVLMSFTYNLGIGMTGGFVVYPLIKSLSGKIREIKPGLWILAGFSLLFFIFYPY